MRGSMASLPQLGLRPRASRLRDASASGHPLLASARMNRQPRIRRRISKRFGGCGSNPSQQQRPRDGRNAVSGSWSRRRDLRLWRRALGRAAHRAVQFRAHPICLSEQYARKPLALRSRLRPPIPSMFVTTKKRADRSQLPFAWSRRRDLRLWRRVPGESAHRAVQFAPIRYVSEQFARKPLALRSRLHPQIPSMFVNNGKESRREASSLSRGRGDGI